MKWRVLFLCALLALLSGCAGQEDATIRQEHTVYCRAALPQQGGDALCALPAAAEGENEARMASDLLQKLIAANGEGYTTPVPAGTKILNLRVENGLAVVSFSGEYAALSGIDLTLADACVTLTLCQLPAVERVSILVEGSALPYREKQILSAADFLLSTNSDEVLKFRVRLYFKNEETGTLAPETRMLQLYEGQTKSAAVLEALRGGPESDGLGAVLTEEMEILGARVEDGICYVNLSKEFLESAPDSRQAQENVIYSLVNSLCSVSDIQAVQFAAESEAAGFYGEIDLSVPLH